MSNVDEPMDEPMDKPMDESMVEPMGESMDEPMDEPMDKPMDKPMGESMDESIDKDNFELIKEIFNIINKKIETYYDLMEMRIDQHYLRQPIFKEKLYDMIPKLKKKYKSHKLTCLHNNSLDKQKFPTINMIRQILKCNKLKLTPKFLCKGYNKINNQKIIERYYIIKKIV